MIKRVIAVVIFLIMTVNVAFASVTDKVFIPEKEVEEYARFLDEPQEVQEARYKAFEKVEYQIDPKEFEKYLKDKHFVAPPKKEGELPKLKHIFGCVAYYSDNTYAVLYINKVPYIFYYSVNDGKLIFIERYIKNESNDTIYFLYDEYGKLNFIDFTTKLYKHKFFGFRFNEKQKLIGVWKADILYNQNNEEILKLIYDKCF